MIRLLLLAVIAVASLTYAIRQQWEVTSRNGTIAGLHKQIAEARSNAESANNALAALKLELADAKANVARLTAERDAANARAKTSTAADVAAAAGSPGANPEN